jgi:flagellar biosynthetic protein FliO
MEILRQILAVGLVLGLLLAALWALRRQGVAGWKTPRLGRKSAGLLAPVERLSLSPQHALHLVRIGDRVLLIGVHAAGCSLLDSFPWRELEGRAAISPEERG